MRLLFGFIFCCFIVLSACTSSSPQANNDLETLPDEEISGASDEFVEQVARDIMYEEIRKAIDMQVSQQYPYLPDDTADERVETLTQEYIQENQQQINEEIIVYAKELKTDIFSEVTEEEYLLSKELGAHLLKANDCSRTNYKYVKLIENDTTYLDNETNYNQLMKEFSLCIETILPDAKAAFIENKEAVKSFSPKIWTQEEGDVEVQIYFISDVLERMTNNRDLYQSMVLDK